MNKSNKTEYRVLRNFGEPPSHMILNRLMTKSQLELEYPDLKFEYDERLEVATFNNKNDAVMCVNYMYMVLNAIRSQSVAMSDMVTTRTIALLDAGFVPMCILPSYLNDEEMYQKSMNYITTHNLQFTEESQYDYTGRKIHNSKRDLWVSRIDAAELMGVKIKDFNLFTFLKGVLLK